jgi:hypothetical protein
VLAPIPVLPLPVVLPAPLDEVPVPLVDPVEPCVPEVEPLVVEPVELPDPAVEPVLDEPLMPAPDMLDALSIVPTTWTRLPTWLFSVSLCPPTSR